MDGVAGQAVSDNTIQRVVRNVGAELAERRGRDPKHACHRAVETSQWGRNEKQPF